MSEPAAVYRRRRAIAGVVALAVLAIPAVLLSRGTKELDSPPGLRPAKPRSYLLPRGGRTIFPRYRAVAFYGAPQAAQLGELGIGTPGQAARKLLRQARPYARRTRPVMPVMELLAAIADHSPGDDGLYRTEQSPAVIDRYLRAVRRIHGLLVLDIQPGHADFLSEVRRLEPWLRQPDVGLALDPEWHTPDAIPGQVIGSVGADEVNAVSRYLQGIVEVGHLPQKLFVIHQFTDSMIRDKQRVLARGGLATVFNVDGFGNRSVKLAKYHDFTAATQRTPFANGFKLFYHEDTDLMAPRDVMRMRPRPDLVVYE